MNGSGNILADDTRHDTRHDARHDARHDTTPAALEALGALLCGHATAAGAIANTLRVDAFGLASFGRTDALDLFATHPLALSAAPHVLVSPQALVVLDETPEGRCIGVFADLVAGVIARLWVVAATAADAHCEAAVPVASDDFLSQLRTPCVGDAVDHPDLDAAAWPNVLSMGVDAIAATAAATAEPPAASSSQAVVMRAFSTPGAAGSIAALYSLRLQEHTAPRRAHRRLALVSARLDAAGTLVHSRLAISDALPVPAQVLFSGP